VENYAACFVKCGPRYSRRFSRLCDKIFPINVVPTFKVLACYERLIISRKFCPRKQRFTLYGSCYTLRRLEKPVPLPFRRHQPKVISGLSLAFPRPILITEQVGRFAAESEVFEQPI